LQARSRSAEGHISTTNIASSLPRAPMERRRTGANLETRCGRQFGITVPPVILQGPIAKTPPTCHIEPFQEKWPILRSEPKSELLASGFVRLGPVISPGSNRPEHIRLHFFSFFCSAYGFDSFNGVRARAKRQSEDSFSLVHSARGSSPLRPGPPCPRFWRRVCRCRRHGTRHFPLRRHQ